MKRGVLQIWRKGWDRGLGVTMSMRSCTNISAQGSKERTGKTHQGGLKEAETNQGGLKGTETPTTGLYSKDCTHSQTPSLCQELDGTLFQKLLPPSMNIVTYSDFKPFQCPCIDY